MADHDDIVPGFVQVAVGLIDNIVGFEDTPALKIERVGKVLGVDLQV